MSARAGSTATAADPAAADPVAATGTAAAATEATAAGTTAKGATGAEAGAGTGAGAGAGTGPVTAAGPADSGGADRGTSGGTGDTGASGGTSDTGAIDTGTGDTGGAAPGPAVRAGAGGWPGLRADGAMLDLLMPLHVLCDPAGRVLRAGPTFARLTGGAPAGRGLFDLLSVRRPRGVTDPAGVIATAGSRLSVVFHGLEQFPLKGVAVCPPDRAGVFMNFSPGVNVGQIVEARGLRARDFSPADPTAEMLYLVEVQKVLIAESTRLNRKLHGDKTVAERLATTDSLTGLANRRALERRLDRLLSRPGRTGFALMQIDLDFFKQVNDTMGHAAGDHVLREVAQMLTEILRPTDFVARIGGDEFVVLLRDTEDPDVLAAVARRIIARVASPIAYGQEVCRIGASIGATFVPPGCGLDHAALLDRADAALYASKEAGRGCYRLDVDRAAAPGHSA